MHNYESHGRCISDGRHHRPGAGIPGWVERSGPVLPLIEQGPMFNSINFALPYTMPDNYTVASQAISSFLCPSEVNNSADPCEQFFNIPKGITSYGLNMGDWYRLPNRWFAHARGLLPQYQPTIRELHRRHQQYHPGGRKQGPPALLYLLRAYRRSITQRLFLTQANPFAIAPNTAGAVVRFTIPHILGRR